MKSSLSECCGALRLLLAASALAIAPLSFAEISSSPRFSPEQASKILTLRNVGLAQLEEDRPKEARATFARLAELLPGEALPLADGAVAALREKDLAGAEALLARAGDRADVWAIRAALENERNRPAAMRAALEKAAALDPHDLESRWRYARSVEADPSAGEAEKARRRAYLSEIALRSPANLPARLKLLLLEVEAGDAAAARKALGEIEPLVSDGDARSRQFLGEAKDALARGDLKAASVKVRVLENLQRVTPRYQQSLGEIFVQLVGLPVERFSTRVEEGLRAGAGPSIPVSFRAPAAFEENLGRFLRKVDLRQFRCGRLYPIPAPFTAVVFFDYDLDGDLDVYLVGGNKPDQLLRNNLDGTFTDVTAKTGDAAFRSRKAVASDVDRDGDLDLVAIDAKGDLVLRLNLRQGVFRTVPLHVAGASDVAVEDVNGDGIPDVLVATAKGLRLLVGRGDGSFLEGTGQAFAASGGGAASDAQAHAPMRAVVLGDFDNDGFPDVVAASSDGLHAWRNQGGGKFADWPVFSSPSKKSSSFFVLFASSEHGCPSRLRRGQRRRPRPPRLGGREDVRSRQRRRQRERLAHRRPRGPRDRLGQGESRGGREPRRGQGGEPRRDAHGGPLADARRARRPDEGRRRARDVDERRPAEPLRPEGEDRREGGPAAQGLVSVRLRPERADRRLELRLGRARARAHRPPLRRRPPRGRRHARVAARARRDAGARPRRQAPPRLHGRAVGGRLPRRGVAHGRGSPDRNRASSRTSG